MEVDLEQDLLRKQNRMSRKVTETSMVVGKDMPECLCTDLKLLGSFLFGRLRLGGAGPNKPPPADLNGLLGPRLAAP